jgi:hypothetical protein
MCINPCINHTPKIVGKIYVLKKYGGTVGTGFTCLWRTGGEYLVNMGNEPSVSVTGKEFLDWLADCLSAFH